MQPRNILELENWGSQSTIPSNSSESYGFSGDMDEENGGVKNFHFSNPYYAEQKSFPEQGLDDQSISQE